MGRLARAVAATTVVALLLLGCAARRPAPVVPVTLAWRAIALPAPAGPAGTPLLRDLVTCAGRWFLVGGLRGADGDTRPAAWISSDGAGWSALPIEASSVYGRRNVLYAAGCRDGRLAAVGAKRGGAHGNARTSLWRQSGGRLVEVPAPTDSSGAPDSVDLARIAGGSAGWLVAGDRSAGASVWESADGGAYRDVVGLPGSPAGGRVRAFDAVAVGSGWLVVGAVDPPTGLDPVPVGWAGVGRDWRWIPLAGPGGGAVEVSGPAASGDATGAASGRSTAVGELHRVTLLAGRPVAAGPVDDGFGVWRQDPAGWSEVGRFGAGRRGDGGVAPAVQGLGAAGRRLFAVAVDGSGYALWVSDGDGAGWRLAAPPRSLPGGGADRRVAVAAAGDRVVLAVDDGGRADLWWAPAGDRSG